MAQKIPPPPNIANLDPTLNRWFLELTSVLNNDGGINTDSISGFSALQNQVDTNEANITTLSLTVSTLQGGQGGTNAAIAALETRMTTAEGEIVTLEARNQVFNGTAAPTSGIGVDGDWYAKTSAPTHIYVRVSGSWVTIV